MKMSTLIFRVPTTSDVSVLPSVSDEHTASSFNPEKGGSMFLRNFGVYIHVQAALLPRSNVGKLTDGDSGLAQFVRK
jgi:hypothetical protein